MSVLAGAGSCRNCFACLTSVASASVVSTSAAVCDLSRVSSGTMHVMVRRSCANSSGVEPYSKMLRCDDWMGDARLEEDDAALAGWFSAAVDAAAAAAAAAAAGAAATACWLSAAVNMAVKRRCLLFGPGCAALVSSWG